MLFRSPYDTERMADIIRLAFEMPAPERRERMRHMRAVVRSRNVYRWAADIVADVAAVRPPGDRALSVR